MESYSKLSTSTEVGNKRLKLVALGDISIIEEEQLPTLLTSKPAASIRIRDVTAHALGVLAWDDQRHKWVNRIVIPKDTPLPSSRNVLFTTTQDNQTEGRIIILEGEDEDPQYCTILGSGYLLSDIPPRLRGVPRISVILGYDRKAMVHVTVQEMSSGQELSIKIDRKELLTEGQKANLKQQIK